MRYFNLALKMKEKAITIETISFFLDCHRNSIYNKMYGKGNSDFTVGEAFMIRDQFFPDTNIEDLLAKEKTVQ